MRGIGRWIGRGVGRRKDKRSEREKATSELLCFLDGRYSHFHDSSHVRDIILTIESCPINPSPSNGEMSELDHCVDQKTSDQRKPSGHLTEPGLDDTTMKESAGLVTIKLQLSLALNNPPKDNVHVLTACRCEERTVQCP